MTEDFVVCDDCLAPLAQLADGATCCGTKRPVLWSVRQGGW